MLTCINATLWRHYEYGLKMPRQENLEKIAQALDVPMQMLFPIDTCTPEGIATLLLNMQLQFGSMEIVEVDGSVSLKFPKNEFPELYEYRALDERMICKIERTYKNFPELNFSIKRDVRYCDATSIHRKFKKPKL